MLIATPVWGRIIDRIGPGRVLTICTAATVVTHLPLLVLETPLQLIFTRIAFGLTAAGMPTATFHLLRIYSPPGMDSRAISYATAFHFFAMGLAPFTAGLIGPVFGMRAYFALTILLMVGGFIAWRRADRPRAAA
jgi:MFS family permease